MTFKNIVSVEAGRRAVLRELMAIRGGRREEGEELHAILRHNFGGKSQRDARFDHYHFPQRAPCERARAPHARSRRPAHLCACTNVLFVLRVLKHLSRCLLALQFPDKGVCFRDPEDPPRRSLLFMSKQAASAAAESTVGVGGLSGVMISFDRRISAGALFSLPCSVMARLEQSEGRRRFGGG